MVDGDHMRADAHVLEALAAADEAAGVGLKRRKSGTSQYPGGRQTNNRVLFACYSRVIRALAAISVSYSVR